MNLKRKRSHTPKKLVTTILTSVALLVAVPVGRADALPLFDACEPDMRVFCERVTPGDGRLLACLYAHKDKISEACGSAVDDVADMPNWFVVGLMNAVGRCGADIETHCSAEEWSGGGKAACLIEKKASISGECREVVEGLLEGAPN